MLCNPPSDVKSISFDKLNIVDIVPSLIYDAFRAESNVIGWSGAGGGSRDKDGDSAASCLSNLPEETRLHKKP